MGGWVGVDYNSRAYLLLGGRQNRDLRDFGIFRLSTPKYIEGLTNMQVIMNVMMTIWQSKTMTFGVACEILAVIAALLSPPVIPSPGWLPYAALLMATIGAAIVAGKVAWDYHGRGLNARQRNDVQDILTSAGLSARQKEDVQGILANATLNATQTEEVAEAIKSSGLTERQKSELAASLTGLYLADTVFAQKAVADAMDQLNKPGHGVVVVIHRIGLSQWDVQSVAPPWAGIGCVRQHARGQDVPFNFIDVTKSLNQAFIPTAFLWRQPGSQQLRYTNNEDPNSFDNQLVFNLYDCVPEWRVPATGDYVLTYDPSDKWTWKQKS